jgi:hypothetical protein
VGNASNRSVQNILSSEKGPEYVDLSRLVQNYYFTCLLCGCETWSVAHRGENNRFTALENRILRKLFWARRSEMAMGWITVHSGKRHIYTFYQILLWAGAAQYSAWLRTGRRRFDPRQRQRIFPLTSESRPALGPTQRPVQWVLGVLYPGVKGSRGVMLTTHPLLVPRLRKSRSYTSSPPKRHHGV